MGRFTDFFFSTLIYSKKGYRECFNEVSKFIHATPELQPTFCNKCNTGYRNNLELSNVTGDGICKHCGNSMNHKEGEQGLEDNKSNEKLYFIEGLELAKLNLETPGQGLGQAEADGQHITEYLDKYGYEGKD